MKVFTLQCDDCGGIVAANVLARGRITPCPTPGCQETFSFDDLPEPQRDHILSNLDRYGCDQ